MKKELTFKEKYLGHMIPKYFGLSYVDFSKLKFVYYLKPFNYLVRLLRNLKFYIFQMFYRKKFKKDLKNKIEKEAKIINKVKESIKEIEEKLKINPTVSEEAFKIVVDHIYPKEYVDIILNTKVDDDNLEDDDLVKRNFIFCLYCIEVSNKIGDLGLFWLAFDNFNKLINNNKEILDKYLGRKTL